MSAISFTKNELAAALSRGVRQCVIIGARLPLPGAFKPIPEQLLKVFTVAEEKPADLPATFVPTEFESEPLAEALEKSGFDKQQPSLFVWLGGAGYRTLDAAVASLAFIASLPKGSGVLLDYAVERTALPFLTHTALDALASRISEAGGTVRYLIQPQAVAALLRGLGFQSIVDLAHEEQPVSGGHLVSAVI